MSFQTMIQETLGSVPGCNYGLAKSKLNEAFQAIQNENTFSFQLVTAGILTPGLLGGNGIQGQPGTTFLSPGTITVQPYTNTITGDVVATQAWNAVTSPPLLTVQQIRVPYYSVYSIIAQGNNGTLAYVNILTSGSGQTPGTYVVAVQDAAEIGSGATVSITVGSNGEVTSQPSVVTVGSGYVTPYITFSEGGTPATFQPFLIATLTIDRPWMEPAQISSGYLVYQCYFAMPAGFKRHYQWRDTTNNNNLDFWSMTQIDLAEEDAERTIFDEPLYVVPYGPDTRPGSATYGQWLVELWAGPITELPYTFQCQCNWPLLQNPNDTVPFPLTEELVKLRTYELLCLWKEMQKGDNMERGAGANWQFLAKAYHDEYENRLKRIRIMDRHLVDVYFQKMQRFPEATNSDGYATIEGQINVGSW
jgi:hypothetical protein